MDKSLFLLVACAGETIQAFMIMFNSEETSSCGGMRLVTL